VRATLGFPLSRLDSVSQDWRSPLPPDKSLPYLHTLRFLETSYAMFSVNLDEAIGLRRSGQLNKAYQVLSISPSLCKRLSGYVRVMLRAMLEHAKHFRVVPNVTPLEPENFQHPKCRRAAGFNGVCSRLVLSKRSQLLHKLSTLTDLIDDLEVAFTKAAADLKDSASLQPEREWSVLDTSHYDMNTCLRESIVLLKSFLHALPPEQVPEFSTALQMLPAASVRPVLVGKRHLAHRRMTLLKGQ